MSNTTMSTLPKISMTKTYVTEGDKLPVRVLCVDRKGPQSVVCLFPSSTDPLREDVETWYDDGKYRIDKEPSGMDLIEATPTPT